MGGRVKSSRKNNFFKKQDSSATDEIKINRTIGRRTFRKKVVELSDLEKVLNSLEQDLDSNKINKKVLKPVDVLRTKYFCCVCRVYIDSPGYDDKLRFSIWEHISDYSHRRRLYNFPQVEEESYKIVKDACEKINVGDTSDFKVGPARGFLLCTVCSCAVPSDPYHIKHHLGAEYHCKNKSMFHSNNSEVIDQLYDKLQAETKPKRKKEWDDLISDLPEELNLNEEHLKTGIIPGYFKCKLCCKAIISTLFHLECHLFDPVHNNYKVRPFQLKLNNVEDPILTKIKLNGSFSPSGMNTFLTLVSKTLKDSVLKENARFLFKQYKRDCYFCHLCDVGFSGENTLLLFQNFKNHFQDEAHNTNVKIGLKAGSRNKDRFQLLEVLPEDVLSDIKYISISESLHDHMVCSLCDSSVSPIQLTVLIDHLQSKHHKKNKNLLICSKGWTTFTVESLFQEIVKNQDGKSSNPFFKVEITKFQELIAKDRVLMNKQFFNIESLQLVCQLCNSVVGKAQSDINELRHKLTEHALSKRHKKLVAAYLEGVEHEKREREEELARLMAKLLEIDRSSKGCFKLSKKPDVVKCRACRVKVLLQFECLKAHIEQDKHRDNIDKIRSKH